MVRNTTSDGTPPADGTQTLGALRPGDYLMAALSTADLVAMQGDRTLTRIESLGPLATPVTLREGDTMTIELKLVKLPEKR